MNIIGFNLSQTSYGIPLDNGGACLIVDGRVKTIINEERLNRKQYSPGYKKSIEYVLTANNLTLNDIDLFVTSSCLESERSVKSVQKDLKEQGFSVPIAKILVCNHHLSHAYSAYYPSTFDKAIVMVLDGDGNALDNQTTFTTDSSARYWENTFEHNSYFIAEKGNISLLERDDIHTGMNGFGGAYRYFTYFCGFPGYKYAGKLMGLSAYGAKRNTYKDITLFDCKENGQVVCLLPDTNRDKAHTPAVVEKWLQQQGVLVKARKPEDPITEEIEDIAFMVQRELDRALLHKVTYLVKKTGIKKLCIAGGVGLNAVTNRVLLDKAGIEELYIQPAAGDSGQCLGNAYAGVYTKDKKHIKRALSEISAYQGRNYSEKEILSTLRDNEASLTFTKLPFAELAKNAAEKIANNHIIGWFQGKSEMGPRALGNRSILANPCNKDMKNILNLQVKHREKFRPFAPSVLAEKSHEWFDIGVHAPYMIMNAQVLQPKRVPSITHEDGSARLQSVSKKQNARYYALITEVERYTQVPIVINTSFNDNEAIVETPADAINCFLRTGIDYLFIGNYMVQKKIKNNDRGVTIKEITHAWTKTTLNTQVIQGAKSKVLNKKIFNAVAPFLKPQTKLFDYTCEWGEYADYFSKKGCEVHARNESPDMVLEARKKFPSVTFYSQKEFKEQAPVLQNTFDVVMSNLWLCILQKNDHAALLSEMKKLLKKDGLLVLSLCHPCFDYMPESIITHRIINNEKPQYKKEFKHHKIVHENGLEFVDYHRPLHYYTDLFKKHDLKIMNIAESDILGTHYFPDFIIFVLQKK